MIVSDNAMTIMKERVLHKGETPEDMVKRVAKTVAMGDEVLEEAFYSMMNYHYFLPNSPCLANAGTLGQLSACFVLPIEDSMESIMGTLYNASMIQKTGGGTGFSFNRLRPRGDVVQTTGGEASGPVSFMRMYNAVMEEIKQGGRRRGASLGVLNVDHLDILEFIECKRNQEQLTNFNISVGVTDEFMTRVQSLDANALQVWELLTECAWETGEPGILFLDAINRGNPTPHLGKIEACNPCWTADTKVWTVYGFKDFRELAEMGECAVLSQNDDGKMEFKMMRNIGITRKDAELVSVRLDNGAELKCTPDHNLYLTDGTKVMAKDLKPGERLQSCYRVKANSKGYLQLNNKHEKVLEHHAVCDYVYGRRPLYPQEHIHHIDSNKQNNIPQNITLINSQEHNAMNMWGEQNPMYGVWDEKNPLYGRSVSRENNGRHRADISINHVLNLLNKGHTIHKIAKSLGCDDKTIKRRIEWSEQDKAIVGNHKVVSVTPCSQRENVYNGVVDDNHNYFVVTGDNCSILSANCGEADLLPYESCVLGSINLSQLVKDGKFDFVKLKKVVGMAVHFLDNVIDCSVYPMPEIEHATKQTRKIGLGIMGLADAMYLMGIRYGSERFYELSEEIMKSINTAAQKQSKGLAQEKGSYPAYIPPNLRRNAVVTSIAPTGTLASIAGTSFSAEPNYGLVYKRTILDGREMYEVNPIFQRELRRRGLDTEAILEQVAHNNGSVQGLKGIPADMKEVFVTAYDLTWDVHVKIQSVLQKHVEQSISKTINMAENATVQDIKDAYMMAWESNCKGITVYRDGSRANQVLSTDKHTPTKRPDVLEGKTHKFNTDCGSLYVTVNRDLGGDPHEIFTAHSVKQGCVNALLNSLARVTSISLRSGVDPAAISKAMMGQVCGNGEEVTSCADALGVALRETQPPVCSLEGGCATCG